MAQGIPKNNDPKYYFAGLWVMVGMYVLAGMHAAGFMGNHVNRQWRKDYLEEFENRAFKLRRRFIHHWFYWAGLAVGLTGLIIAFFDLKM